MALLLAIATPAAADEAPAPAETPPPPPEPPMFKPYGVFKPTVIVSNGVESFGQTNQSSVTAAANPVFAADPESMAYTFQVAQSRLGVYVGGASPVRGQLEIDFLHLDMASPTTNAYPRLRIAEVQWTASARTKVVFGQGWDVFSPLNPHGYNLTGAQFLAGNSGYIRHQAYVAHTIGEIEIAGGVGLPGANNTATVGMLEGESTPSGVGRVSWRRGTIWIGASAVGSSLAYRKAGLDDRRRISAGGNVFAELAAAGATLRVDAYGGQNTANIGLLTLAAGTHARSVHELGGYLSAQRNLGAKIVAQLSAGGATILDDEDVPPAYTMPTDGTAPTRSGLGITWNVHARASCAYTLGAMSLFVEPFVTATRHVLAPTEAELYAERRVAGGVETGLFYKF